VLVWLRRRFHCANCGERHTETHPTIEGKLTARLERQIVTDARQLSITEIARRYGLSWHSVMTLVREWSSRLQAQRRKRPCRILLVDETVRHEALGDRVRCDTSPPGCRSSPVKLGTA
jgi:hypothetical protein